MENKITKYFDDQAYEYDAKYGYVQDIRSFIFSERKRIVLSLLGKYFDKVLDAGCGPGVYADELTKRCNAIYGIDPSSEMVRIAKDKGYSNAGFSIGAIENLQFEDGFFDAAICVGVLEYLDDIENAVQEISRVLKSGGVAIFTVPNASSLLNKLDYLMRAILKFCRKFLKIDVSKSFINYDFEPKLFNKKTVEFVLRKYGLAPEESRFHIFGISFLNRVSPRFSLFLAKKFNFIANPFLAINYIVKARKA